ncbi:lipase family protein [Nocardia sp. bgisy118]|uniref:lipase family protein n=1 Tax=Nocardia sp. bgisy118 TaxID=3413786 RepID=UPI003F4A76EE
MKRSGRKLYHRNRFAVLAVVALVGALAHVTGAGPSAGQDGADIAGGRPGDLAGVEPYTFRVLPVLPTPTRAWKIFYHSTDATGRPDVVSGTVIVPEDGRTGTRPLVTYAVGTVGMGDQCAPSATLTTGTAVEAPSIARALEHGWAVVITDYPGLGTPGDHTYLVGRAEGNAVLDAARAAQRLPEAQREGVTTSSPVGIMGYSQGGHASAWAGELARDYAPELQVEGIASGGVPADVLQGASDGKGQEARNVGLSMMIAIGHDAAYPELKLDSYLTGDGRTLVQKLRGGCVLENVVASRGRTLEDLLARNPIDSPEWQRRLGEDRLGTRSPAAPVYLYHGTTDEVVPYGLGEQLRSDWCALGASVEWHTYPLAGHGPAAVTGGGPAMDWLADRLEGRSAQSNC